MREYIRMHASGGQFFLTLVTCERAGILTSNGNIGRLRWSFTTTRKHHPFTILAAVIMPDHLPVLVELPPGDADLSTRVALVKSRFKPVLPEGAGVVFPVSARSPDLAGPASAASVSASGERRRERTAWQRRFREHTIRDSGDLEAHVDYIHNNPGKHGYAACAHAWPHSSFHKWVQSGRYPADWACSCVKSAAPPPSLAGAEATAGERPMGGKLG